MPKIIPFKLKTSQELSRDNKVIVSKEVAEFAFKVSKAMETIASSNVFFVMQVAYGEGVMYDYSLCEKKWKAVQEELSKNFK